MLAPGVTWLDDWFAVEEVAPGVVAIGEPRFHQNNWNYLILGRRRALLFDTGPGVGCKAAYHAARYCPAVAHAFRSHRWPLLLQADYAS